MGHRKTTGARAARTSLALLVVALPCLVLAPQVLAATPHHPRLKALDITGLNHACGAAVDSKGDIYASSAGESKVKVFNEAHTELTSIPDSHEPCGLAVNSKGELFVSEQALGDVVRYKPNAYPLSGTPTYGSAEAIDSSGNAKGISVDPSDDRLYVAEGSRVSAYDADGSFAAANEVQNLNVNATGGSYRLAMPAQGGPGRNEIQRVGFSQGSASLLGGTFRLLFKGEQTGTIQFNATAATVQTALGKVKAIGAGNVAVTGPAGGPWWVEFTGALAETDVPSLVGNGKALNASVSHQFIEVEALSDVTAQLPYTDGAGEIETALEGLKGIGAANVEVQSEGSGLFHLNFGGALAHTDVPALSADTSALVGFAEANEQTKGFSGHVGEGALTEATGVAAYTSPGGGHYLYAADAQGVGADRLDLFSGPEVKTLKLRREITGPTAGEPFGFGAAGAYLTADPGNKGAEEKCVSVAEQACTAGHLLVYDAAHEALDEFDASGEFLDQTKNAAFSDAEPSAIAVDRSGGAGDGTIYLTAGAGAGAKALAFGPLGAPSRPALGEPLSHVLASAGAVATDSHGDVYAAAGASVHVFDPSGKEVALLEDSRTPIEDLAVDSTGKVYVLENEGEFTGADVTYYTPSAYPPVAGTTYARHEPPVATRTEFPLYFGEHVRPLAIAVNPGPGPGKDHLFVTSGSYTTHEYDSAAHGSTLLNGEFAQGLSLGGPQSLAVDGASGKVYFSNYANSPLISVVNAEGTEVLARINGAGSPNGQLGNSPAIAVDQSNGHLLTFQAVDEAAREYDASGAFVAEFGHFTNLQRPYRIAVDSACATHEPPLSEATTPSCHEYDPANGNAYVAFADTAPGSHDVTAFGPLGYGEAPSAVTGTADGLGAGSATLNGTVDPNGFELSECKFEYLTEAEYEENLEEEEAGFEGAAEAQCHPEAAELGHGSAPVAVHATIPVAEPEERYLFRLLAKNQFGEGKGKEVLFGPPVITAKTALPIGYTEATLRGRIDPSGLQTKYRFEYLTDAEYLANGETFAGAQSTPTGTLSATSGPTDIEAFPTELAEGTAYDFRLLAENEDATVAGPDQTLVTLARRGAEACPNAEYRTGLSANLPDCRAYELVTPAQTNGLNPYAAGPGDPGAGFSDWLTAQRGPGTGNDLAYFTDGTLPGFDGNGRLDGYRAARASGDHPAAGWQSDLFGPTYAQAAPGIHKLSTSQGLSPDQLYSFWKIDPEEPLPQTLPAGAYLRTPSGFEALGRGSLGEDLNAVGKYLSAGGAHVIFSSKAKLEPEAPPQENVALYDREAGSASAHVLTLPPPSGDPEEEAEFAAALRSKEQAAYRGASEDGSAAVVFDAGVDLYVRLDDTRTERITPRSASVGDPLSCAAGPLHEGQQELGVRSVKWLRNAVPISGASGNDNGRPVHYSAKAEDEGAALQCLTVATEEDPRSVAISAPVWVAPLESSQAPRPPAQIAAPTPANPTTGAVETCDPGGWQGATSLSYQWYVNGKPISAATAQTYEVQAGDVPGTIQCVVTGKNTAAALARASGLQPTSPAPAEPAPVATAQAAVKTTYEGVSDDGRYVFFALGDGASSGRLFRFDTQTESATEIAGAGIFALVSPDGSHALFSSTEALTGGEENENHEHAEATQHNLYAWNGTATRFIAQLSAQDFENAGFAGIPGMNLAAWTAAINPGIGSGRPLAPTRSTPDGSVFAFQSHARLTAYDNEGVGEIYRYDPAGEEGGRLTCVSCDPSGAPPGADALFEDIRAGSPLDATTQIANLTDNGSEVFFQSADRLLPEDANEVPDVYEWKAKGAGGPECKRAGGCLALISSGQGETPSYLYGMSADGHDVFFRTLERLLASDAIGSSSIYDAREGGGIPEPSATAPCQGDSCQGQGSEPPTLSVPASTGSGGGNVSEEGVAKPRCVKGKRLVRRHGKSRCVKRNAKKHHRRANRDGRGSR